MRLVKRRDFVNVKFQSIISDSGGFNTNGQFHHMILPMRESRLLQFHMHVLNGECPFKAADKKSGAIEIPGVPNVITQEELHDSEFVEENGKYLNMMKDLTKT